MKGSQMESSLKNKITIITGSTRGFGFAIAEEMLKAGAIVVLTGRTEETLQQAITSLTPHGQVSGWLCDVRDEMQVYALARNTVEKFGRIDIWVNNAGYSSAAGMVLDIPPGQAIDMFLANDMGTLYGTQAALHFMLPLKAGTLVNIYGAGSNGKASSPTGLYAASKAWVTSFTRTLAIEIKGSGVRLVAFSPGMMLTDMLTNPTVIGERVKDRMKNFGFVLRFLGQPPQKPARMLVRVLEKNTKEFSEHRVLKPWSPFIGLVRVGWENLTKTGKTPDFTLHYEQGYIPEI
jgi:NAD(P)-dependent dehydrogenase (short-subunit alcohol dehydrogenase family)